MTEEFVVTWKDPKDAERQWMQDRMHAPEPGTPLGGSILCDAVSHGFGFAFNEYSVPAEFRMTVVNNWVYASPGPRDLPLAELERMGAESERRLSAVLAQLGELWDKTYLPEIKSILAELEEFDRTGASMDELIAHWERTLELSQRLFEIHFLVIVPSYVAVSEFDELYRKLFEAADAHESYRLLQGHDNKTVETGRAQWELSRRTLQHPQVVRVLEEETIDADTLSRIETVEGGPEFLADLSAYLDEYGQRGDLWDLGHASWIEDPSPVLRNLREYLGQDDHPGTQLAQAVAERDRLIAQARECLTDPEQRGAFDFLLAAASVGIVLTEDHGFWIDFKGMHQIRMAALECGRRYADAGLVERADDVCFLHADEITETAREQLDRRALVVQRRASFELAKTVTPPPTLGTPAPEGPDEPVGRSQFKFFGGPPPVDAKAGEVLGNPGSAGVATGRARVITSIDESDRLEPGDVLVAKTTSPPWTPLFAIASAVVIDTGGILCHCAVVAREYGIPAVVGCGNATVAIRDGQTIEVDGTRGVVRIVD